MTSPTTTHQPRPTKRGWINSFYRYYKGKKLGPIPLLQPFHTFIGPKSSAAAGEAMSPNITNPQPARRSANRERVITQTPINLRSISKLNTGKTNMSTTESSNQATKNRPKKKGWINCFYRTYKGKKLGPYFVRRWKVGRKLYKEYIKSEDLEQAKQEAADYKEKRKRQSATTRRLNNNIANLAYMVRMVAWEDQGRVRPQDHAKDHGRRLGDRRPPLNKTKSHAPFSSCRRRKDDRQDRF